jgi:predicted amidohydrolase
MSGADAAAPAAAVRVGLVQLRPPPTLADALAHAAPLVRRAAAEGARLVATPEATNVVQRDRTELLAQLKPLEDDPVVNGVRALACELGIALLIGSALVRRGDGKLANRSILVDDNGAITATYDKIHMFDVDLPNGDRYRESAAYTPGDQAVVADSAGGRLGLSVCYDLRFPALYRALALAGAEVIAVPSAFTRPTGEAHWETLLRARAIETGAWVLAPAQGGLHADGRGTWGRSLAVSPWGEVTARLDHDEPGVLIADLDLAKVAEARTAIPALANARTFAAPQVDGRGAAAA